jgi:hypothetical protein
MSNNKPPSNILTLLLRGLFIIVIAILAYYGWQWLSPLLNPETSQNTSSAPSSGLNINVNDGDVLTEPVLELAGNAFPDRQLLINGQPIPVNADGSFNLSLRLAQGPNLIIVETTDAVGNSLSLIRKVVYTLPGVDLAPEEIPPSTYSGMLGLALLVILTAVVIALLRRRKPWIRLTIESPTFTPSAIGVGGAPLTVIVELDRTTRLSLHIHGPDGKRLTTLLNNRRRVARRHTFTWNGYNFEGDVVQPGNITIRSVAGVPPAKVRTKTEIEVLNNPAVHP